MKMNNNVTAIKTGLAGSILILVLLFAWSCAPTVKPLDAAPAAPGAAGASDAADAGPGPKGLADSAFAVPAHYDPAHAGNAAQLWVENCNRCHNVRSPDMYSDAQWEVVAMHMRVRANLTPVEYREILAFLKSSH